MQFRFSDLILVVFVVATAAMLVVPLPTPLLDLLLVCNISFSILLLLVGLYIPNAQALFAFPTVLLLSTLFRLGLNVASSRLILSQGDAGRVIEAFGTFLIGGEIIVGIIVFAIITIVNFIVISKGAGRVSEVAARFSLDALPGKQLAIDNDARSGLISAEEAKQKRDNLTREGQLYGSMDGAMNFVQGDAIAGFFIILANIVGGILLGLSNGMPIQDAVQTYTMLTVGDGLVTQIPSLLTSICAGIVVTRVGSSDTATLSNDLRHQFFSQPITLVVTGVILLLFSAIPGIPMLPFILISGVAIGSAGIIYRRRREVPASLGAGGEFGRSTGLTDSSAVAAIDYERDDETIQVYLDSTVLFRVFRGNPAKYLAAWREYRADFFSEMGIYLPEIDVRIDEIATPSSYRVVAGGTEMLSGHLTADAIFVEVGAAQARALGLEIISTEAHPISGHKVFWTPSRPSVRKQIESGNIVCRDFFEFISLRIFAFCLKHPAEFVSVTSIHSMLRGIEKRYPGLVGEGFGREFVSAPKLTEILQELVRQGVSIRDFKGMLEAIASYCSSNGISLDSDQTIEVQAVVAHVRATRRRQVTRKILGSHRSLKVLGIAQDLQDEIDSVDFEDRGLPLPLGSETLHEIAVSVQRMTKPVLELGVHPMIVLCRSEARAKVSSLLQFSGQSAFVVGLEELESSQLVEQIGLWSLGHRQSKNLF
jgi:type III secretion protein V